MQAVSAMKNEARERERTAEGSEKQNKRKEKYAQLRSTRRTRGQTHTPNDAARARRTTAEKKSHEGDRERGERVASERKKKKKIYREGATWGL